jgi:outer membrane protein assembly factor BamB
MKISALITLLALLLASCGAAPPAKPNETTPPQVDAPADAPSAAPSVKPGDWGQWGGSSERNNVVADASVPTEWNIGEIDWDTGAWKPEGAESIRWVAKLGSMSYGNPVIANGKVYVGTNNDNVYVKKHPKKVDLGCLIAFNEADGSFLWQHSNPKLATGDQHDWGQIGVSSAPLVTGKRLFYVNNRAEVVCLDTEGFHDDENDGYDKEADNEKTDADVIWAYNMMKELGTEQRNATNCSVTLIGDALLVNTSNGADEEGHVRKPKAASFIALHKDTGKLLWKDSSPDHFILGGQWSSPAAFSANGVNQAVFAGADGWVYSFKAETGEPLWRFDLNPKGVKWDPGSSSGKRNSVIATPVFHNNRIYLAAGQNPENGSGDGYLWCIDTDKTGDISAWLAVGADDKPLERRRFQAIDITKGEKQIDNPNSGVVWSYVGGDINADGKVKEDEKLHRAIANVTVAGGLAIVADFAGVIHCLDAETGKAYWTHDTFAALWGAPLVVGDKIYIGSEDGVVLVFDLTKEKNLLAENDMQAQVQSTPVCANGVLYVMTDSNLFAIGKKPAK